MKTLTLCWATALVILCSGQMTLATTFTLTQEKKRTYWDSGRLNLVGNPINQSGVSPQDFFSASVKSLQKWAKTSQNLLKFDYWQGTNPEEYESSTLYNGHNSIYFLSNQSGGSQLSSNIIALTQLWYDEDSGEILESDIVLNDIHYNFTMNPADTTGFGSGGPGFGSKVFLEGVITHELGHAFGLSHTGTMQSSMFYMEAPDQSHISCDDITGIRTIYANSSVNGSMSRITGTIKGEDGKPVFGANVVAISARRGHVLSSALTDNQGRYMLSGLEPGAYALYVEPFYAGASALPLSYAGVNSQICSNGNFGRSFLTHSDGHALQILHIGQGSTFLAPTFTAKCSPGQGAAVNGTIGGNGLGSAPDLAIANAHSAVVDRVNLSQAQYYRLPQVSGKVEVSALGYSLYSFVRTQVDLLDSVGNEISTQTSDPVYESETGFKNYDSKLSITGLPIADYYVRVTATPLSSNYYPAGTTSMDSAAFSVISVQVNAPAPTQPNVFPLNTRCRGSETFAAYASPSGDPPRGAGGGFCASIKRVDQDSRRKWNDRQGFDEYAMSAVAIASWLTPWLIMLMIARAVKWTYRLRKN